MQDNQQRPEDRTQENISEQARIRREKLAALQSAGEDPYRITRYDRTHLSAQILRDFDALEGQEVTLAGRMMSRRIMGKASFAHLQDGAGQIQVYIRREDVGEDLYAAFKSFDIGDILGVRGTVFRTKTGEISLHAASLQLLSKSLLPLPEKYHGLKDNDLRYRQRYVWTARASWRWTPRSCCPSRSAPRPGPLSPTTTRWTWTCTCASRPSSTSSA